MGGTSISVALSAFRQPLKQALQTAASLKVDGIEIDARNDFRPGDMSATAIRQLRKMLNDLDLTIKSVRFITRRGYDSTDELDRRVSATKDAMKMATELGCNVLVNSIGKVAADDNDNAVLREVLSDLGRHSYHYGCFLACETGAESLEALSGFIRTLPEESVFIALHPAKLAAAGFNTEQLDKCASLIRVVYAADGVPDRSLSHSGTRVPLGQGIVDLPQIVGTLEDSHVKIPYIVDGQGLSDPIAASKQAIEFLRRM